MGHTVQTPIGSFRVIWSNFTKVRACTAQWLVTILHVCEDNEESVETHNLNFPQNHG